MDSVTLPLPTTLRRKYKHFQLTKTPAVPHTEKLQFFYIGAKSKSVDFLVKTFDSGFAAENLEDARSIMNRIITRSATFPDLLIADANIGPEALTDFIGHFRIQFFSHRTPVIIDTANAAADVIAPYRQLAVVDDIVNLKTASTESMLAKTSFWIRVKQSVHPEKDSMNPIAAMTPYISSFLKRTFDIVVSSLLLLLLSPVFLLIMLALRIESKGPFLYISKRAGKGYRIFNFYKFRTMEVGAEERLSEMIHLNQYTTAKGPLFLKIFNDPRVTRVGAFLRNTSLDELPQLINVLKGDMSLVGNRPLPLYEAASLTTNEWSKRFLAPAGITGLWQITRRGKFEMSAEERINLDINYADRYNFLYDLWIMANTPSALIQHTNV